MVLRVSATLARVWAMASAMVAVPVATPERWPRKFSATRSPVSSPRAGPDAVPITVPGCDAAAVGQQVVDRDARVDQLPGQPGAVGAGDHARLAGDQRDRRVLRPRR